MTWAHLLFFAPLALDPFLTGVSNTIINAFMARSADREVLIAGYGVAKNLLFFLFGSLMMVRQTVTCFAGDERTLPVLKRFFTVVVAANMALLVAVAFTPLAAWVFGSVLGVRGPALGQAVRILRVFALFPIAVGFRHFWQGVALKDHRPGIIAVAIIGRVAFLVVLVLVIYPTRSPSAEGAGLTFLSSVSFEGILVYALILAVAAVDRSRRHRRPALASAIGINADGLTAPRLGTTAGSRETPAGYREVAAFFLPLAATVLIRTMALPIVNAGLSRTADPTLALASFTVGWELGYIFLSPLMFFHHVPIEFLGRHLSGAAGTGAGVPLTAAIFGIVASATLVALGFTPAGPLVLTRVVGVDGALLDRSIEVLRVLSALPVLYAAREYCWGVLMHERHTRSIGVCKSISLGALVVAVVVLVRLFPSAPSTIAFALVISEAAELVALAVAMRRRSPIDTGLAGDAAEAL